MRRSFVIAHISDLHLDGNGTRLQACEALRAVLDEKMAEFSHVPNRLLLITGDLVESPTNRAIGEAKQVVSELRDMECFSDVAIIAGNHDVKMKGLVWENDSFYKAFDATKSAENRYFKESGLDLLLLDSNQAAFAMGKIKHQSFDELVANISKLTTSLLKSSGDSKLAADREPENSIVRVLALHHHPLPIALGEGKKVYGVPDEPLMQLASPATLLEAAMSMEVPLILHGHRHVEGLTRYSVPNRYADSSECDYWKTVYVLSCPSSTGADCDAGFNIIQFGSYSPFGRVGYRFSIRRFTRPLNTGKFVTLERTQGGYVHIPLGDTYHRDIALQIQIEISADEEINRKKLILFAKRLLTRRAFFNEEECSWAHALFAYLATYLVWNNSLLSEFAKLGSKRDLKSCSEVSQKIWNLVEHASNVLGIDGCELDNLRYLQVSDQKNFLDRIPTSPLQSKNENVENRKRIKLLKAIDKDLGDLTGNLGLGGEPSTNTYE